MLVKGATGLKQSHVCTIENQQKYTEASTIGGIENHWESHPLVQTVFLYLFIFEGIIRMFQFEK